MIAIIDYGMGNLHSVYNALQAIGTQAEITSDPATNAANCLFANASRSISSTKFGLNIASTFFAISFQLYCINFN